MTKTVLITGVAGFIGYSLAKYLVEKTDYLVIGLDNLNNYYDVQLKRDRLNDLGNRIKFYENDLNDDLDDVFKNEITYIVNLAAQAGVRYSKKNPDVYIESNINGFYNLMKTANKYNIKKILYASSSSVYGASQKLPFSEKDQTSTPMSLYAATKLSDENLASSFFYTHNIRTIGLRFFNIYGPFGRPDMAYFKWTDRIKKNDQIELNNNGEMWRDMTYITDCVEAIIKLLDNNEAEKHPEVYNIGNKNPVKISDLLMYIADELNLQPSIKYVSAGSEEPIKTWANTNLLQLKIGFSPATNYQKGMKDFLNWHNDYYE